MSRICIIGPANLINISLISIYTNFFDKRNIEYDLIYWDRLGLDEETTAKKVYKFQRLNNKKRIWYKISDYLRFRKFAIDVLNKNKYDYLITWQTSIGYLLADKLLLSYRNRYIINIRDYIAEKKSGFNILIKHLTKHSLCNTISSDGFLSFLPKGDYKLIQSVNENIVDGIKDIKATKSEGVIKIGYVGSCRYFAENKKLIDKLANDERFELWYCGSNSEILKEYAAEKGYKNVFTFDRFKREDTIPLIKKMSLINSCFGSNLMANRTLVPIRLFTAISQGLPVLASSKTYLERLLVDKKLGIGVDVNDENLGDHLNQYYHDLNCDSFCIDSKEYLLEAIARNRNFEIFLETKLK